MSINIIEAIRSEDPPLFRPYLADRNGSIATYANWRVALRVLYGLPIKPRHHELIRQCTGRDPAKLPSQGFRTALFLTGRRCGKSRVAALIAAFEASMSGREELLAPGEKGIVPVISPTKAQSRVVRDYVLAAFESSPVLKQEIIRVEPWGFDLANGVRIEILSSDFRTTRGFTLIGAVVDELAFMSLTEEQTKATKTDEELLQAIRPALLTTRGRCICITSPYARRGAAWRIYEKHFGNDCSKTLVWNCDSQTMNPTLSDDDIEDMVTEDPAAAESEVFGRFRDDVASFISRDLVESLVVRDRTELLPSAGRSYFAFCDISGGRGDDAAIAIAHRDDGKVVLDFLKRWKPPFSPQRVVQDIAKELKRWQLRSITGDNYSADFVSSEFKKHGITYRKADRKKSDLYRELLPVLTSGNVELLDSPLLVDQLSRLERRTRSGGKEVIDHPKGPKQHDDMANVLAGVVVESSRQRNVLKIGCLGNPADTDDDSESAILIRRQLVGRLAVSQAKQMLDW